MSWRCEYRATTRSWSGDRRRLHGFYEGGGNIQLLLQEILQKRIRKLSLWQGEIVTVLTPLGQKCCYLIKSSGGELALDTLADWERRVGV